MPAILNSALRSAPRVYSLSRAAPGRPYAYGLVVEDVYASYVRAHVFGLDASGFISWMDNGCEGTAEQLAAGNHDFLLAPLAP